jgi:hypothetical protein
MKLKTLALVGLVTLGLFALAVMGGNTAPTCVPVPVDQAPCLTALDCGAPPECGDENTGVLQEGSWTCEDGLCVEHCPCTYEECGPGGYGMPNWLCPDGSLGGPVCDHMDDGACGWFIRECPDMDGDGVAPPSDCDDEDASIFPGATEVCDGIDNDCDAQIDEDCGTSELPCMADADCPDYWFCALMDCADPSTGVDCGGGGVCVPQDPYPEPCYASNNGTVGCPMYYECACLAMPDCPLCDGCYWGCVLPQGACWDNGDCEEGKTCEGAFICPEGAACFAPDSPGECVDKEDEPMPCALDSAGNYWCPTGYHCDTCLQDPDCLACAVCWAGCVLDDGVCWDDGDCPAGETCVGASICPPGAYCFAPDTPGECQPEIMPCEMDYATGQYWCPEGYQCDTCLPDPSNPMLDVCWAGCVPKDVPCNDATDPNCYE